MSFSEAVVLWRKYRDVIHLCKITKLHIATWLTRTQMALSRELVICIILCPYSQIQHNHKAKAEEALGVGIGYYPRYFSK